MNDSSPFSHFTLISAAHGGAMGSSTPVHAPTGTERTVAPPHRRSAPPRRRPVLVVGRLVWDSRRAPAPGGTRTVDGAAVAGPVTGEGDERHLQFQAGGIDVVLDLYPCGEGIRVEGQVLPPADVIRPVFAVEVRRGTSCVATAELDDLGEFTLDEVEPGPCRLTLVGGRLRVYLEIDLDLAPRP
jgi:hypothetical protein